MLTCLTDIGDDLDLMTTVEPSAVELDEGRPTNVGELAGALQRGDPLLDDHVPAVVGLGLVDVTGPVGDNTNLALDIGTAFPGHESVDRASFSTGTRPAACPSLIDQGVVCATANG